MQWTTTHSWDNLPDYPEPKPPTKRTRKPAPPTQAPSSLPVVKPSLGANISIPQNIHLLAFGAVVLIGCYLIVGRKSTPNSERAELGVGSIAVAPSANTDYKPSPDDRQAALDYIARYAHVAQEEQQKYGIPASITLAQGLLETDAGRSKMAQRDNNHFGIKCFSKSCKRGHCTN